MIVHGLCPMMRALSLATFLLVKGSLFLKTGGGASQLAIWRWCFHMAQTTITWYPALCDMEAVKALILGEGPPNLPGGEEPMFWNILYGSLR
jgi:hypothetical protein